MLFGLEEPGEGRTLVTVIQVLLLVLLTIFLSRWLRGRVERAVRTNPAYAEIGSIASWVVGLMIYVIGITLILAALGANWTILATVLGAATLGISLSFQDVGRNVVDGVYVLVERPYRLGDHVRIGTAEGRVEQIGVRMTNLRTADGELISIPNNLVFTSVIENASIGALERQRFTVKGITGDIPDIEGAVTEALAGLPQRPSRAPVVTIVAASPEGADVEVSVEYHPHTRYNEQIIARLRENFPEAVVALRQRCDVS
jgi:small-conductance mechanosensitive channel